MTVSHVRQINRSATPLPNMSYHTCVPSPDLTPSIRSRYHIRIPMPCQQKHTCTKGEKPPKRNKYDGWIPYAIKNSLHVQPVHIVRLRKVTTQQWRGVGPYIVLTYCKNKTTRRVLHRLGKIAGQVRARQERCRTISGRNSREGMVEITVQNLEKKKERWLFFTSTISTCCPRKRPTQPGRPQYSTTVSLRWCPSPRMIDQIYPWARQCWPRASWFQQCLGKKKVY